jgi:hypothetical protein
MKQSRPENNHGIGETIARVKELQDECFAPGFFDPIL